MMYRYEETRYAPPFDEFDNPCGKGTIRVNLYTFQVVRKTPKGVWIDSFGREKFVLLRAKKKYAHFSKEEALESFIARKNRQSQILNQKLQDVNTCLYQARLISNELQENKDSCHHTV